MRHEKPGMDGIFDTPRDIDLKNQNKRKVSLHERVKSVTNFYEFETDLQPYNANVAFEPPLKEPVDINYRLLEEVCAKMKKTPVYKEMRSRGKVDFSPAANPCPEHPHMDIQFICTDDKIGLCEECLYDHMKKNHHLSPVQLAVREVKRTLFNLERNTVEIIRFRGSQLDKVQA